VFGFQFKGNVEIIGPKVMMLKNPKIKINKIF
jgi:hypothetical protein